MEIRIVYLFEVQNNDKFNVYLVPPILFKFCLLYSRIIEGLKVSEQPAVL